MGDWIDELSDEPNQSLQKAAKSLSQRVRREEPIRLGGKLRSLRVIRTNHISVRGAVVCGITANGDRHLLATCPDAQTGLMVGEALSQFHQVPVEVLDAD